MKDHVEIKMNKKAIEDVYKKAEDHIKHLVSKISVVYEEIEKDKYQVIEIKNKVDGLQFKEGDIHPIKDIPDSFKVEENRFEIPLIWLQENNNC